MWNFKQKTCIYPDDEGQQTKRYLVYKNNLLWTCDIHSKKRSIGRSESIMNSVSIRFY